MSKSLTTLSTNISKRSRQDVIRQQTFRKKSDIPYVKNLFNSYQISLINDKTPLIVYEKSRRIGATFALSFAAFRDASLGVCNTTYSTYNLFASRPFMKNVANWCKAFNIVSKEVFKTEIINENQINTFTIKFSNGFEINAVPSDQKQMRGIEGRIIRDEAAHTENLLEDVQAALAITIRGGQVIVLSTHYGVNNDFNKLCRDVEYGEIPGSLHTTTFKSAIDQGMFRSMCAIKGEIWTPEKEYEWEQSVRQLYKHSMAEELDVIPSSFSRGTIFHHDDFEFVEVDEFTAQNSLTVMYFDLASTDESIAKKTSYYTAWVKILVVDNLLIILDADATRKGAAEADQWMENAIKMSSAQTISLIEQEPGSSGKKYCEYFKERVQAKVSRQIESYQPTKSKMLRALPLVPMIRSRESEEFRIVISETLRDRPLVDKDEAKVLDPTFLGLLTKFDGSNQPLVNDFTDCVTGAIDYIMSNVLRGY
jgi:hypothetical protein